MGNSQVIPWAMVAPLLLANGFKFVPAVAALVARRPADDAATRIAIAWALTGVVDIVQLGQFFGEVQGTVPATMLALLIHATILLPALASWTNLGVASRLALRVAVVLLAVAPVVWLGPGRSYDRIARPLVLGTLAIVAFGALVASLRARDDGAAPTRRRSAVWIGGALVGYFAAAAAWLALLDYVSAHDRSLVRGLHTSRMSFDTLVSIAIAYGMLLRPAPRPRPAPTLETA